MLARLFELVSLKNATEGLAWQLARVTFGELEKKDIEAHGMRCRLTTRLRQAAAMMSDCQPMRDPGLACSRMVRPTYRLRAWCASRRRTRRFEMCRCRQQ